MGEITEDRWAAATGALRTAVAAGDPILLVCHVNPDGDALGSMLAVGQALRKLGATKVQATYPGPSALPEPFLVLPGLDLLVDSPEAPVLMVTLDAAAESRLGAYASLLGEVPTIVLDHHASYTGFGDIPLVDSGAAATAVVAAELISRLGVPLDLQIAECLYIGVITDTGSFKYALTTPEVHRLAADLLETGLDPGEISSRVFDTRPFGAVKLYGEVLSRAVLEPENRLVWSAASLADLERHGQAPYVLEGLIDGIRCAAEADVACLLKQVGPAEWSVSMRSRGGVDLSRVAVALGGGGHRAAAGFTGYGTPAEIMDRIRIALGE
ncbi:MAG: bifunctional oligoribonuclease/PAP phosphatase NrnA [Hamadaea sp.]|uniref:DHH family phosphoesterase n=1 Tax=Hamadaea sp. TaxID=2024425 RepID=UPI0017D734F6|nr:DHH family phosphoesterase [Hamadaea sp.]NUT19774.1 bifunctional oligoribonuclease/PAP phosphatase NrnA [Hamadaea sp.]